jgi:dipeptidyl aminopeptidase/acylaminoacyl peptidase
MNESFSPDGRYIVFTPNRASYDLWLIDKDGKNLAQLTHSSATDTTPSWISNHMVIFSSDRSGDMQIWVKNRIPPPKKLAYQLLICKLHHPMFKEFLEAGGGAG